MESFTTEHHGKKLRFSVGDDGVWVKMGEKYLCFIDLFPVSMGGDPRIHLYCNHPGTREEPVALAQYFEDGWTGIHTAKEAYGNREDEDYGKMIGFLPE